MICLNCGKDNAPGNLYCSECGALLQTAATVKKQKWAAFFKAAAAAVCIYILYYGISILVYNLWQLRFISANSPFSDITELNKLLSEAFSFASGYLNIIVYGLCLCCAAVFYFARGKSLTKAAGVNPAPAVKTGAAFTAGLCLQIPLAVIIGLIPFSEEIIDVHSQAMSACTSPIGIQLLLIVILAPITEEILFRGIIHDRFARAVPVPVAAVISSAVFGYFHGEILAGIAAFFCGLLLAAMYSRFKTVFVPMAFHMGFNAASFIIGYITDPVLFLAALFFCLAMLVGSIYLLFRKDDRAGISGV